MESKSLQLQIHGVDGQQLSLSVDPELSGAELLKLVRQQLPSKQGLGLWLFQQHLPLQRRETLRHQLGSTEGPRTLNYFWTLPKFQAAWNLLVPPGGRCPHRRGCTGGNEVLSLDARVHSVLGE